MGLWANHKDHKTASNLCTRFKIQQMRGAASESTTSPFLYNAADPVKPNNVRRIKFFNTLGSAHKWSNIWQSLHLA